MLKEIKKIMDKNKILWTDLVFVNERKIKRKINKATKRLFEIALLEAYQLGLNFHKKLIKK